MCSWCEYLGQGKTYDARLQDVEEHEKNCEDRE